MSFVYAEFICRRMRAEAEARYRIFHVELRVELLRGRQAALARSAVQQGLALQTRTAASIALHDEIVGAELGRRARDSTCSFIAQAGISWHAFGMIQSKG